MSEPCYFSLKNPKIEEDRKDHEGGRENVSLEGGILLFVK